MNWHFLIHCDSDSNFLFFSFLFSFFLFFFLFFSFLFFFCWPTTQNRLLHRRGFDSSRVYQREKARSARSQFGGRCNDDWDYDRSLGQPVHRFNGPNSFGIHLHDLGVPNPLRRKSVTRHFHHPPSRHVRNVIRYVIFTVHHIQSDPIPLQRVSQVTHLASVCLRFSLLQVLWCLVCAIRKPAPSTYHWAASTRICCSAECCGPWKVCPSICATSPMSCLRRTPSSRWETSSPEDGALNAKRSTGE